MALPARDHRITLAAAAALTRRHREGGAKGATNASAFHADQVRALLAQPGCVGLRIYHGKNADGSDGTVIVGVDANDKDMTSGTLLENGFPCPPLCDNGSALNG